MTRRKHRWFRHGWYRAISKPRPMGRFLYVCKRLAETSNRSKRMEIHNLRFELGGMDEPFKTPRVIEL